MTVIQGSPIFVVGTGRSGSTIFHRLLCTHHKVAWLNRILSQDPSRLAQHRAYLRMLDAPGIGRWITRKGLTPAEAYPYWNQAYRGFGRPMRDLIADDVTELARKSVRTIVESMTTRTRNRPLLKITGWPRIGFLSEIFEDAVFVHVVRDGRSVANSMLNVRFWRGWEGPGSWRLGPLSPEYEEEWLRHDRSFVALAGIAWKIVIDAIIEAERLVPPGRFVSVRYEDFCDDPIREIRRTAVFAGLDWTDRFEAHLRAIPVSSRNDKWRTDLTSAQRNVLNDVLEQHLDSLGYLDSQANRANTAAY